MRGLTVMNHQIVIKLGPLTATVLLNKTVSRAVQKIPLKYWNNSRCLGTTYIGLSPNFPKPKYRFAWLGKVLSDKRLITGRRCGFIQLVSPSILGQGQNQHFHTTCLRCALHPNMVKLRKDIIAVYHEVKTMSLSNTEKADTAIKRIQVLIEEFQKNNKQKVPFLERKRLLFHHEPTMKWLDLKSAFKLERLAPHTLSSNSDEVKRVEEIVKRLKLANPEFMNLDVSVHVFNVDEKYVAASTGNGHLFLSSNVIRNFDDDELAFIVAHEMGHIAALHMVENKSNKVFFAEVVILSSYILEKFEIFSKSDLLLYQEVSKYIEDIVDIVTNLIPDMKDKERHEYEADYIAVVTTKRANYEPREDFFYTGGASSMIYWEDSRLFGKEPTLQLEDEELHSRKLLVVLDDISREYLLQVSKDLKMKHPRFKDRRAAIRKHLEEIRRKNELDKLSTP